MSFLEPVSEELRFLFITSNASIAPLNEAKKDALRGDYCAISVKKVRVLVNAIDVGIVKKA